MKRYVERWLLSRCNEYLGHVEEPTPEPPWPNYEAFPGDDASLVGVVVNQGFHLPPVIAWERANQNRPAVIAGLEAALAESGSISEHEALTGNVEEYVR